MFPSEKVRELSSDEIASSAQSISVSEKGSILQGRNNDIATLARGAFVKYMTMPGKDLAWAWQSRGENQSG